MNSKAFQIFIALSIPIIIIIVVLVLISLERKSSNSEESNLPYDSYTANPKNHAGNSFDTTIEIDSQLAVTENEDGNVAGKVILVKIIDTNSNIPVYIPNSLNKTVLPKQKFKAKLKTAKNGGLHVVELNKI